MRGNNYRALFLAVLVCIFLMASLFPHEANARLGSTIYVFDLDQYEDPTDRADWYDMSLFVATLQGIVNQDGPKLYIRNHRPGVPVEGVTNMDTAGINKFWLDKFRQRGQWLSGASVTVLSSVDDLISTFKSSLSGVVVWDPKVEATVNAATTIAGVERAPIVMAGGAMHTKATSLPHNLTVRVNLNGMFTGVNSKTDAYNWAIINYLDNGRTNPGMVAYLEDGFVRQPGTSSAQNYAVERDYIVKNKGFVFDLSPWGDERPNDAPDQTLGNDRTMFLNLIQSAYNQYGVQWPVQTIGFFPWWDKYNTFQGRGIHGAVAGEWKTVEEFSKKNIHISSVIDTIGMANGSFHSWAPIGKGLENPPQSPPRTPVANKTYILYYMGDHDGGTMRNLPYIWEDKRRGTIPLAWGIVPNMIQDFPDISQYLYDTATPNDYFVAGASGAGYANPGFLPNLDIWTQFNELFHKRAGYTMNGFLLNGNGGVVSNAVEQQYSKFSGDGLIGHDPSIFGTTPAIRNDNMAVAEILTDISRYDVDAAAQNIYTATGTLPNLGSQPNFIAVRSAFAFPRFIELLNAKIKADRPAWNYEAVDPFTFFSLIRQAKRNQTHDAVVTSVEVPDKMVAGVNYDVSVTVRNVGSSTWTMAALDRLGDTASNQFIWSNLNGGFSNGLGNQRVFLSSGDSIAPQVTKTFNFTVTAPSTAGTYTFASQMVRDGVAWMGSVYTRSVTVVAATGNQAIVTGVTVPATMTEGSTNSVSVTIKNVGNTTWTAANNYRLGSFPYSLVHKTLLPNQVTWTNLPNGGEGTSPTNQRVYLAAGDSIAPGQSKTFSFSVQAPANRGKYVFSGQMVCDGVEWFGSAFEKEVMVVPSVRVGLDASLVGSTVPLYMKPGTAKRITISLKNVGTETWTAANSYRLMAASTNQLIFSNFEDGGYSNIATDQRVNLHSSEQITPESAKSFTFDITAPLTAGSYTLAVDMTRDGVGSANQIVSWAIQVGGDYDASFSATEIPTQMAAGLRQKITVELTNKGGNTWNKAELYRLGTTANNQIKVVGFHPDGGEGSGPAEQRVYLNGADRIIQEQKKQFSFLVEAPSTTGTYTLELRMVRDGVTWFGETRTVDISVVGAYFLRVNVGGTGFQDANGRIWLADTAYPGTSNWGYIGTTSTNSTTNTIAVYDDQNPDTIEFPASLFQTGRSGSSFEYRFDVPNGRYRITLAFAEIVRTQSHARQFSLKAESLDVLSGFDIFKMYLGRDKGRIFNVEADVADEQLNLQFIGQIDQALLNGLVVERIR